MSLCAVAATYKAVESADRLDSSVWRVIASSG